jgi:hypothetical protein
MHAAACRPCTRPTSMPRYSLAASKNTSAMQLLLRVCTATAEHARLPAMAPCKDTAGKGYCMCVQSIMMCSIDTAYTSCSSQGLKHTVILVAPVRPQQP